MSELYSCMKVSLNLTQDEVINGRRGVGREGGCAGPLEVTRIEGHVWGHSLQIKQCFSLCYKFEVRRCLVLGPSLYCLVIDNFFNYHSWISYPIVQTIISLISLHLFSDYSHQPTMSTSSEIRGILFGDEEHLVKLTELMDYLKIIMEDTEVKVGHAKRDLESQTRAILRIHQLLKEASNNRRDPYHNFL